MSALCLATGFEITIIMHCLYSMVINKIIRLVDNHHVDDNHVDDHHVDDHHVDNHHVDDQV